MAAEVCWPERCDPSQRRRMQISKSWRLELRMAGKNVGTTLLSVVVAIGAFVASNIWSQSLHETVDRLAHATEAWNVAYNAVNEGN